MTSTLLKIPLLHLKTQVETHGKATPNRLRDFGLILAGGLFVIFGVRSFFKGHSFPPPIFLFCIAITACALTYPKVLKPLYQVWMLLGSILGFINTRIILGLVFFLMLTPIAFLLRCFGLDVLGLKRHNEWQTYRVFRDRAPGSMQRQF